VGTNFFRRRPQVQRHAAEERLVVRHMCRAEIVERLSSGGSYLPGDAIVGEIAPPDLERSGR
jgi:hypothetical protein